MSELQDTLIPYEDMLKAGMHFGRKKTVFHPSMGEYVFTVRDGIHIIDLLKTQEKLKEAAAYLKQALTDNKLVLFVSLTKQAHDGVKVLAETLQMPYILDRWLGGILTNFKVINARVKKLEDMERQKASGELETKYTKKERLLFDRELAKMSERFGGLKRLTRLPDVIFVASVKEGKLPIAEAKATNIPVVGIVNTDANPNTVAHPIPANERSKMSVDLILTALTQELSSR